MKILNQIINCIFTYFFSFLGLYVWSIDSPLKWIAILIFLFAVLTYAKFTYSIITSSGENLCSRNWLIIIIQLLLIALNVFVLVYTINKVIV